jgi:hypothetical protein
MTSHHTENLEKRTRDYMGEPPLGQSAAYKDPSEEVCIGLTSGQALGGRECPLCANSGHRRRYPRS